MAPELSIIIPCARPEALLRCLEAIEKQPKRKAVEVIAVGDVEHVRSGGYAFSLKLLPCAERHANARRNLGLAQASAPRIAFLDDDAMPIEGWLDAALRVDPTGEEIITGPELPVRSSPRSQIVYEVARNRIAEGSKAHVNRKDELVSWTEAPFCNFVTPAAVFDRVGILATDVPWDMDDFEFCSRARNHYRFRNDASLLIRHDRYPDSYLEWLKYKWGQRVRIGNKLVSHPKVYARIPAIVLCALFPLLALGLALLAPRGFGVLALVAVVLYVVLLALQAPRALRSVPLAGLPAYYLLFIALHAITLVGVQWGIARALAAELSQRLRSSRSVDGAA